MRLRQPDPNWGPSTLRCFSKYTRKQLVRVESFQGKTLWFTFDLFKKLLSAVLKNSARFLYTALLLTTFAIGCILLHTPGSTDSPGAMGQCSRERAGEHLPSPPHSGFRASCPELWYLHLQNQLMPSCCIWLGKDPLSSAWPEVQEGNTSVPSNCTKGEHPLSWAPSTSCPGCHVPLCSTCRDASKCWPRQSQIELPTLTQASVKHVPLVHIIWLSTRVLVCSCFRHVHVLGTLRTNING